MPYDIFFSEVAYNFLRKFDKNLGDRIKNKILNLKNNPTLGKPLKYSIWWSLRIGEYRAIYKIKDNEKKIIILLLAHRKNVYDDFSKLL